MTSQEVDWVCGTRGLVITGEKGSSVLQLREPVGLQGPAGDVCELLRHSMTHLDGPRGKRAAWEKQDAVVVAMASIGEGTVVLVHGESIGIRARARVRYTKRAPQPEPQPRPRSESEATAPCRAGSLASNA